MEMKKFVALFDMHFGRETVNIPGKGRVKRNTHDLPIVRKVLDFVDDFKPDTVILGGDQLNCGPVSHWHKGKPLLEEGTRLKWEYDLLNKKVLSRLNSIKEKVWLQGNHEVWINTTVESTPGLEGLIEPENYLSLASNGWQVVPSGCYYRLGKLYFYHGDNLFPRRQGGKFPVEKAVRDFRRNLRFGHYHSFMGATDITPIDIKDQHTAIAVPALCRRDMAYMNGVPSCANQGFLYGYVRPDGSFNDYVVFIVNGKFTVEGKTYGGK